MLPTLIVGAGAMSSVGLSVKENWKSVLQSGTGVRFVEETDCLAARKDNPEESNPLYRLAMASLDECLCNTGWSEPFDERTALIFAFGSPDKVQVVSSATRLDTKGRCRPDTVFRTMNSYVSARPGKDMHIQGPVYMTAAACAGSSHAIHLAHLLLASGTVDRILCGGGEILDRYTLGAFVSMRTVLAQRKDLGSATIQPFGAERSGMALGEGCGWQALTRNDAAGKSREARILMPESSVINVPDANSGDIAEQVNWQRPIGSSAELPCDLLLAQATLTPKGDLAEGKAILQHFPESQVCSTKHIFGHTLSTSSILDAIIIRESMKHGYVMVMGHDYSLDSTAIKASL